MMRRTGSCGSSAPSGPHFAPKNWLGSTCASESVKEALNVISSLIYKKMRPLDSAIDMTKDFKFPPSIHATVAHFEAWTSHRASSPFSVDAAWVVVVEGETARINNSNSGTNAC